MGLPACLCAHKATGFWDTNVPYEIRFSPTNNTYVMTVGNVTSLGTYTWTLMTDFQESSGRVPDTTVALLTLTPHPTARTIQGEVRRTFRGTTFTSPLGVATFNISDVT